MFSDETIYRLSVYRLIGSVYRYRTDLKPILNLNSVLKKQKQKFLFYFFFLGTDFSFGIGSKSVDTDFPLTLGSIAMLYSQVQAMNCIKFHINASLIPISIPNSNRIHTEFIPISIPKPIPIPRYFGLNIPIPIPNSKSHTDSSLI